MVLVEYIIGLPGADAGVGCVVGLGRGAAKEYAESLMVDRVQTVQLRMMGKHKNIRENARNQKQQLK